jgi:pimeloyl-ACP methyl ester carboxylesterase
MPVPVSVTDPDTKSRITLSMTASGFGEGLRLMLYDVEMERQIPLVIAHAASGDFADFATMTFQHGRGLRLSVRAGLQLSVSCPEDVSRIRAVDVAPATAGRFTGDYRVRGQMAACSVWPKSAMPANYFMPFKSSVPTLIVSGDLDPVTPPQWGEEARKLLPNSLHVVVPGGHVSDSPCLENMAQHLFDTGRIEGIDTSCVAAIRNPLFELRDVHLPG